MTGVTVFLHVCISLQALINLKKTWSRFFSNSSPVHYRVTYQFVSSFLVKLYRHRNNFKKLEGDDLHEHGSSFLPRVFVAGVDESPGLRSRINMWHTLPGPRRARAHEAFYKALEPRGILRSS
jgi:hypothetical protein